MEKCSRACADLCFREEDEVRRDDGGRRARDQLAATCSGGRSLAATPAARAREERLRLTALVAGAGAGEANLGSGGGWGRGGQRSESAELRRAGGEVFEEGARGGAAWGVGAENSRTGSVRMRTRTRTRMLRHQLNYFISRR